MSDVLLLEFCGAALAFPLEEVERARARAQSLLGTSASPPAAGSSGEPLLVDAEEMARLTSTAASWWESAARELDCPSVFVGRVRRFKVADCLAWLETVQERDGNGHARRCGAVPRARA